MITLTVKGKDYPIKITTRAALDMEEKLGTNPLNTILKIQRNEELPDLKTLLVMLHYSLQKLNHGISWNDTLQLFDDYCEDDGDIVTLLELIVDAFKESGLIKVAEETDPNF